MSPTVPAPEALSADMPAAIGAAIMARTAIGLIEHSWQQVMADDDPEGPHQLRVGLRRLRTVLRTFRSEPQPAKIAAVGRSLVTTGRLVAPLRELDVLVGETAGPHLVAAPDGGAVLLGHLQHQRAAALETLRRNLGTKRVAALRQALTMLPTDLERAVQRAHPDRTIERHLHHDLKRRWRRVLKRASPLADASPEALHDLRKALKNLRYAFHAAQQFWPDKAAHTFEAALKRVQVASGTINDAHDIAQLPARIAKASLGRESDAAVAYLLGWHAARSEQSLGDLSRCWQDLADTKIARDLQ